jgi:GntR family transcriptional regulator
MYGLFESEFGVRMIRAEEKIRAVAADAQSAELLAVAVGAPLLLVERLSLTYGDKPVECAAACTTPSRTTIATS